MTSTPTPELTKADVELHTGPPIAEAVADVDESVTTPVNPKLTTKKFALQAMLEKAAAVVPSRDVLPVLKNFLLEVTADKMRIAATDLELSIVVSSQMVTVERIGNCVLPAKVMLDIVREADDGEIIIDVANGKARIGCGQASWDIQLQDAEDYPPLPEEDDSELTTVDRGAFVDALMTVRTALGRDTIKPNLMVVDVKDGRMRASDGVRFQQVETPGLPDMQIPANAVGDLVKILRQTEAKQLGIGQDETSLIFRIGLDEFVASKPNAKFPDVDEVLLKPALTNDLIATVEREELVRAIKRVRITANPETNAVAIGLSTGKLTVTSRDKNGSTSRESIDAAWDSEPKTFAFNHAHLSDLLGTVESKTIKLAFGLGMKQRPAPLLVQDKDQGLTAVLTQLRADWLLTD